MVGQVSIKEAARRLGVSPKEIRRRIKNGDLVGFVQLPETSGSEDGNAAPTRSDGVVSTAAVAAEAGRGADATSSMPSRRGQHLGSLHGGPDSRDVEIQRLQTLVSVLRDELEARRREVQELHVLLREQQRTMLTAALNPALPRPATDPPRAVSTDTYDAGQPHQSPNVPDPLTPYQPEPNVQVSQDHLDGSGVDASEGEVLIDWQAYDAESEHLRHTMGRLQELLEELERVGPDESEDVGQKSATVNALEMTPHVVEARNATPQAFTPIEVPPSESPPSETLASGSTQSEPLLAEQSPPAPSSPSEEPPTGSELTQRREAMGLSRELVAASTGLSWGFVTEVERGRRKDARSRQRLADALAALKGTRDKP